MLRSIAELEMASQNPLSTGAVALTGASGTIGSATRQALEARGHRVAVIDRSDFQHRDQLIAKLQKLDVTCVISCMASRTGTRQDAWRVDYQAQSNLLKAATALEIKKFVLLSAICVQKPKLEFQRAKLAFEEELKASQLDWSIVRPTAFFKSLSGQVARVRAGKAFLMFGNGELTACKPISDSDLATFLVDCLDRTDRSRKILPVGGPGPAISPRGQLKMLESILGRPVRMRAVPPQLLIWIANGLGLLGRLIPRLKEKAEYARIGHYYATESMLVWDPKTQRYDEGATPSFGNDRLEDHYRLLLREP